MHAHSAQPARPRSQRVLLLALLLMLLLFAVPAYTPAYAQDDGAPAAPAEATPAVAIAPGEYLEIAYVDQLTYRWDDSGSGAKRGASFWHPAVPAGWYALGSYGIGEGAGSIYGPVLVAARDCAQFAGCAHWLHADLGPDYLGLRQ